MAYKLAMEYDPLPLDQKIKDKIVEIVSFLRSIEKNKLEARLIKEDKTENPYKVFACKIPPKKEDKAENPKNDMYSRYGSCGNYHGGCHNYRYNPYQGYHSDSFPMEDQSGETPEAAIEKFFTEAAKSIARQIKTKEKEFARVEKEFVSLKYALSRIEAYANDSYKEELEDKKPEKHPETKPLPPPLNPKDESKKIFAS